jgi:DNA-binding NtrC family response regulator
LIPRLLLVDDDPRVGNALRRELTATGYEVFTATDVFSALQVLESYAIDVIVSDEQMPGACGTDLMVFARERFPTVVRIILSGKGCAASRDRAQRDGAVFRYLEKPCPTEDLLDTLRLALTSRRGTGFAPSAP